MTLPFSLPAWMPSWLGLVLLLVGLLYALAMLAMPFSVFGVKSRLEAIEEQLEQVQEELRILTMRLPEPLRGITVDEGLYDPLPRAAGGQERVPRRPTAAAPPPLPPETVRPAPRAPIGREIPPPPRAAPPRGTPPRRIEPRLD